MQLPPQNLTLRVAIEEAFPGCAAAFSDAFIEDNPSLMEIGESVDMHIAVPAYMAWCARNGHRSPLLVHDYTVDALAVFGRTKRGRTEQLDFKYRCTEKQKYAVLCFLHWYLDPALLANTEQVKRAIKHWSTS